MQRFGRALVVASQAAKAGHRGKTASDNPTSGRQNEAALGRRELDDFQAAAMLLSGCRLVANAIYSVLD